MNSLTLQRALGLGLLLLGLGSCGTNVPVETAILTPSDQWQTLTTANVQLDLPPGYVGGDPGRDLEALQRTLVAWEQGDRTEWLSQNAAEFEFLAFQRAGEMLNSINIVQEDRPKTLTLADYLQRQTEKLEAAGITATSTITATSASLELRSMNLYQRIYIYPTETVFWVITYSSGSPNAEFTAGVEQSQQSFQVRLEPS